MVQRGSQLIHLVLLINFSYSYLHCYCFCHYDYNYPFIDDVYITDKINCKIRKVTVSTGIISTIAGSSFGYSGDNGAATSAKLYYPNGVALDSSGNKYY